MNDLYLWGTVAVIALVTAALRFLPFVIFRGNKKTPPLLEKLGKVTRREGSSSTFEIMMHRSFYVSPGAYQRLREKYTVWMVRNVISGLEYISGYLLSKHGTNRFRFKITKKQVER